MSDTKTPGFGKVEVMAGPPPQYGLTDAQIVALARRWYAAAGDVDPQKRPPTLEELAELARVFGD